MEDILFPVLLIAFLVQIGFYFRLRRDFSFLKKRLKHLEHNFHSGPEKNANPVEEEMTSGAGEADPFEEAAPPEMPPEPVKQENRIFRVFRTFEQLFVERWMAVIAVVILVAGISFFGIWASSRITPFFRFWMIVAAAAVIAVLSFFASRYEKFKPLSDWLRSSSAAVYLFASLGAGGIPGIQWIQSPLMSLLMLISGISVNMILAFLGRKQIFSSVHVVLGIVAIAIAPQSVVTMSVAAVITFAGISISYRSRWDLHHLVSVLAFFAFLLYWSSEVDLSTGFYNISALSAVIVTSLLTLFMHYRMIYADYEDYIIPLVVHLVNWLYLAAGLLLYAPETDYVFIPLFLSGGILFFLARHAGKTGIFWLQSIDTLISQLMIILSVISLTKIDLDMYLIAFIILVEILGFILLVGKRESLLLETSGLAAAAAAAAGLLILTADSYSAQTLSGLLVHSGVLVLSGGAVALFLLYRSGKPAFPGVSSAVDRVLQFTSVISLGILGLSVPVYILTVYIFILISDIPPEFISSETFILPLFAFLLYLKFRLKNRGMSAGIFILLFFEVLFTFIYTAFEADFTAAELTVYYLPVMLFPVLLTLYSLRVDSFLNNKLPGLYILAIHFLIYTNFLFTESVPADFCWLGLFLAAAGISYFYKPLRISEQSAGKIRKAVSGAGYLIMAAFMLRFLLYDIQPAGDLAERSLPRYIIEIVSVAALVLRYFLNREKTLMNRILPLLIFLFSSVLIFIEVPSEYFGAVFALTSVVLLTAGFFPWSSLQQFARVSFLSLWMSVILTGLFSVMSVRPGIPNLDSAWYINAGGVILEFIFLGMLRYIPKPSDLFSSERNFGPIGKASSLIFRKNHLFLYYPVFASVLVFIIRSFDGPVLTALISLESLMILVLSLMMKADSFRYAAVAGIIGALIRLVFFDLGDADIFIKAVVFVSVSVTMLIMNVIYNKFRDKPSDQE